LVLVVRVTSAGKTGEFDLAYAQSAHLCEACQPSGFFGSLDILVTTISSSDTFRGLDFSRSRGRRKHCEIRQASELASVPGFTTLYQFLKRLNDDRAFGETVRQLRGLRRPVRGQACIAVDAVKALLVRHMLTRQALLLGLSFSLFRLKHRYLLARDVT
jgi:hypothetical protein